MSVTNGHLSLPPPSLRLLPTHPLLGHSPSCIRCLLIVRCHRFLLNVGRDEGDEPLLDLTEEVNPYRDHGMLGLALDPDFQDNGCPFNPSNRRRGAKAGRRPEELGRPKDDL